MAKGIAWIAGGLVALALVYWGWPTPYRYHDWGDLVVREHRLTGRLELLAANGWQLMWPRAEDSGKGQSPK